MHAVLLEEQAFLGCAPEGCAVRYRRTEIGLPGVEMGIEVDQCDRPEMLPGHAEEGEGDRVIAADREQVSGSTEQFRRACFDLLHGFFDVERIARDVASVCDLLGAKWRYVESRMPWAQQPGSLANCSRAETRAWTVRRATVKRHSDDGHVAVPDLLSPR